MQNPTDLLTAPAYIFDVDGTLVDTVDAHADAWQRAFAQFGHTIGFDAIRGQIGKGGDQLLPVFLKPDVVERDGKAIEAARKAIFTADHLGRVRSFPGVSDLFRRLRDRGVRIALASSAKGDELQAYKKACGIESLTDVETSSDDAEKSKPHPDIFEAALQKLGCKPEQALVVGDSPYDAEAAGKAGIAMVGLLCGGFPAGDLTAAGARAIYRDPEALLALLAPPA